MRLQFYYVLLCLILSLCACAKKDDSVLRLGYLQSDLHHLPAFIAIEKGYFSEQGLNVQVGGVFKAGPEEMSAFGSGDLDFGYVGQAPATAALLNGAADIQFIAQVNLEGSAIVCAKGLRHRFSQSIGRQICSSSRPCHHAGFPAAAGTEKQHDEFSEYSSHYFETAGDAAGP